MSWTVKGWAPQRDASSVRCQDPTFLNQYYPHPNVRWLEKAINNRTIRAPYSMVHDYRVNVPPCDWGQVSWDNSDYVFPADLQNHKEQMVHLFKYLRVLRENDPVVRVTRATATTDLSLCVQKAFYQDQVGTNLSLDCPVQPEYAQTVRDWDLGPAGSPLPDFDRSKLANTIGVAIGVYSNDGHFLGHRKRSGNVAIYADQLHLPFSFALKYPEGTKPVTIRELITGRDFREELMEEMQLTNDYIDEVRPVAFCRDLGRGGKPQFFLEMRVLLSRDEIAEKSAKAMAVAMGEERSTKIEFVPQGLSDRNANVPWSPELLAFYVLKRQ